MAKSLRGADITVARNAGASFTPLNDHNHEPDNDDDDWYDMGWE